jgi:hypothetical protein
VRATIEAKQSVRVAAFVADTTREPSAPPGETAAFWPPLEACKAETVIPATATRTIAMSTSNLTMSPPIISEFLQKGALFGVWTTRGVRGITITRREYFHFPALPFPKLKPSPFHQQRMSYAWRLSSSRQKVTEW